MINMYEIFNIDYKIVTKKLEVNLDIGKQRKIKKISDGKLLEKIIDTYKLEKETTFIYIDGSRKKEKRSTGAGLVLENQEIAYSISLPRICSIFTAEAFAIKAALELMIKERNIRNKDIGIMSDSQAVLLVLQNNVINVYKNKYLIEIKKLHEELEQQHGKK